MQYDENAEKYGYEGEMTPMKCDELKEYKAWELLPEEKINLKSDVDAAIAELNEAWRSEHAACEALKAKLEDVAMREHRLRRALWMARALRARDIQRWWIAATCAPITERACRVWNNVERKCLKKAEEYK